MTNNFLKALKAVEESYIKVQQGKLGTTKLITEGARSYSVRVPKEDKNMFEFLEKEYQKQLESGTFFDLRTSQGRYQLRVSEFKTDGKPFPRIRHGFWWVLHNCIAHPLLGVLPIKKIFQLHDWSSNKLNHKLTTHD